MRLALLPCRSERLNDRVVERGDAPCAALLNQNSQAQFLLSGRTLALGADKAAQVVDDVRQGDILANESCRHALRQLAAVGEPQKVACSAILRPASAAATIPSLFESTPLDTSRRSPIASTAASA